MNWNIIRQACQHLPLDLSLEVMAGFRPLPHPDPKLWVMGLRVRYTLSVVSSSTTSPPCYTNLYVYLKTQTGYLSHVRKIPKRVHVTEFMYAAPHPLAIGKPPMQK